MTDKKHGLDVFRTLNQINSKNQDFFLNLTEEEQKAFQPYVVMRWMSGTNDYATIMYLNELINPLVFSLGSHKDLLYKLLTVCSTGPKKYRWINTKGKKTTCPTCVSVVSEYYEISSTQSVEALHLLTDDDIIECAESMGRQKEDIDKIKKELKTR